MKTLTKVVVTFFALLAVVSLVDNIYNLDDSFMIHLLGMVLPLFMIAFAYIVRQDKNVNIFSSIDESMFNSCEDINLFLNAHLAITIKLFLPIIIMEIFLIIAKIPGGIVDIAIMLYAFIMYIYNLWKITSKYTK